MNGQASDQNQSGCVRSVSLHIGTEKRCTKCGEVKTLNEFHKNPSLSTGLHSQCKECRNRNARIMREDHPERDRKASLLYRKTHPENKRECLKRHNVKHPDRMKARKTLGRLVRTGKIKREPCEKCGDFLSHGHHDDYSKPLDVKWLCALHHREYHRRTLQP